MPVATGGNDVWGKMDKPCRTPASPGDNNAWWKNGEDRGKLTLTWGSTDSTRRDGREGPVRMVGSGTDGRVRHVGTVGTLGTLESFKRLLKDPGGTPVMVAIWIL
jgi:hypothetical protein